VVDQQIPPILPGQAIAKLEIPRIDKAGDQALYVLPGVDYKTLHDGPGHYPDTPLPGQLGNAAIAGHRSTSGAPFADVDQLADGDEIVVTMLTGDRFVYVVTDVFIVEPSDYWVVGTTDPDIAQLTLTSCHPRFSARQRIVVQATLKPEASAPPGRPTFYDLDDAEPLPSTPATTLVDDTVVTVPTEPVPGVPDGSESVVSGPDALTAGWFHDAAAWPHIVAWTAACSLIAFAAARLSRRSRSYLRGWSIAVLPFVVSLYFVYQNVNRLLPPGI
jgi:sortase A